MDYHFAFENHMYSVPFKYRFGKVILRVTDATIEVLLGNKRIASHSRSYKQGSLLLCQNTSRANIEITAIGLRK